MKTRRRKEALSERSLSDLAALTTESKRKKFLAAHPRLLEDAVVRQLNELVRAKLRENAREALYLAEASVVIARRLPNRQAFGRSLRSKANALYMLGENEEALKFHAEALLIFREIHDPEEEARTLIPSIQPLILLGKYDEAFVAAEAAKKIFRQLGDEKRWAHVEINVGNIYHRQDRFEEGLACYERAYEMLLPFRDSEGLAVALYNMAVCLITLNDFPRALATYQRARAMCVSHGMTLLVTQSDYNIAYLYYLRGEYSRAIEMLRATRQESEKNGDAHILALCYLDLSEIYLELNLSVEAKETAHEGFLRFQKLGMGYEEAKCLAFEAMARSQLGKALGALELFAQARAKFVSEKNLVWPWLIDLYQAVVLYKEGRVFEARRLCSAASEFFDHSLLPSKAILCHLLLARISLQNGELTEAQREALQAIARLANLEAPALRYQAQFLMGQIQRASGDLPAAYQSFQRARESLEALRSSLRGEELKIAFMKNRLEVYENLVELCLIRDEETAGLEESFGYIEMAKSRNLAETLMRTGPAMRPADPGQSDLVRRIREMREELNWYYRRLEIEQLRAEEPSPERIEKLQKEALAHENQLLHVLRELPASEESASHGPAVRSLDIIRASLPADAALVEYFSLKDQFIAAIVTRDELKIVPLTPISRASELLRMLHFQISKFKLGAEYARTFEKSMLEVAQAHLRRLYEELVAPIRARLTARHLIIVPHGVLHYLPFHALLDDARYLIDSFTISYAPSASIFVHCQEKSAHANGPSLVMGIPDARAPLIREEVRAVTEIIPGAELLLGAQANQPALQRSGLRSRLIHIATHGKFRQDNPMFSGIRLGDAYLNLYDLYQLKLNAELVTLSGCATGMNVVSSGDELLGLMRGLLHAGAHSLLLTLWDVHDRSTADFMASFYRRFQGGSGMPKALQEAMIELREGYPHPYHWAPFTLIGKVSHI
jgi:CHAT domain-containing protein